MSPRFLFCLFIPGVGVAKFRFEILAELSGGLARAYMTAFLDSVEFALPCEWIREYDEVNPNIHSFRTK